MLDSILEVQNHPNSIKEADVFRTESHLSWSSIKQVNFLKIQDGSGEIEFAEFCQLCAKFLVEEPDEETMKSELKEAFRYLGSEQCDHMLKCKVAQFYTK